MKVSKSRIDFDVLEEISLPSSKPSILTELDKVVGDTAVQIQMSWSEWGSLRRHIAASERKKIKPRFLAKLVSFRGAGKARSYEVAVRRNE